jgi:hypothetical protein
MEADCQPHAPATLLSGIEPPVQIIVGFVGVVARLDAVEKRNSLSTSGIRTKSSSS